MAMIEAHVWYDRSGRITAVGRPHPLARGTIIPRAGNDREVMTVGVAEEHVRMLHRTHRVDTVQRKLTHAAR